MRNKILFSIITLFLFLITIESVFAASATISLDGNSTFANNSKFNIPIKVSNIKDSKVMSVGGKIKSSDTSCISLVDLTTPMGTANGETLAYSNMNGESKNTNIATSVFKSADKSCTATITFENIKVSFIDGSKITLNNISKKITIKKYSADNTLKELNLSVGSINFNSNTTTYNVNVDSNVNSIKLEAIANDSKATITGAGTKTLNYGNNKLEIKVKAENGNIKTYIVNVNRKDNRSSDNKLKSLTINKGTLKPNFDSSTLKYKVSVDYSVSKLDIKAVANDSKAKVTITNPELKSEATTDVTVKVTAENGSTKQYTISVTRGKDPNKKLSSDNYLIKLEPNIGILSPKFEKDKLNYYIYLPYEVDIISFKYEVSDKKYAKVKEEGSLKLKPDSTNKIVYTVTAEDNSKRNYTILVYRGVNPDIDPKTEGASTKLRSIKVNNGKIYPKFDSDNHTYKITKNKKFSYEYILDSSDAYSNIYETDDSIYIVVSNDIGDIEVYSMHIKEKHSHIVYYIIIAILTMLSGYLLFDKIKRK